MNTDWEEAIVQGDATKVKLLLAQGADVNARDSYGQTALMRAAHKGDYQVAVFLVEHGADLDVTAKYNLSALMLAVIGGHTEVVRILVEAGADLHIRGSKAVPGFYGKTALALARDAGRSTIVQVLTARLTHPPSSK